MTIDIDAIRAREAAATPGLWIAINPRDDSSQWADDYDDPMVVTDDSSPGSYCAIAQEICNGSTDGWADAKFIANARTDVPALLARVDEQDAEIQRLRAVAPLTVVFHLWHEDNAWWSANAVYTDCDGAMAAGERKFVEDEGPANTDALRWEPRGQTRWALMDGNEATGVLVDRREIQAATR